MKVEGIIPALVTPTLQGGEALNTKVLKQLTEYVLANNADGVCVLGGTGEYCALSNIIRIAAIEVVVNNVNGRVPVIVGLIESGIGQTLAMLKQSKALGASAAMVITPYYVSTTQQGILDYYCRLSDAVDIPIVIYNIPYRTGANIEPETVAIIAERCNVIGIKECSPNMVQVQNLVKLVGDKISVLSGEDLLIVLEMVLGIKGGILASATLIPDKWSEIYKTAKNGNVTRAIEQHAILSPLLNALFAECNPGPLKAALTMKGFDVGCVMSPLTEIKEENRVALKKALTELGILC